MPSEFDPQEFGRLQAQVEGLERTVLDLRGDVKELLATVQNARGGWKMLMLLGGGAGVLGALIGKFLPFFPLK